MTSSFTRRLALLTLAALSFVFAPAAIAADSATFALSQGSCAGGFRFHPSYPYLAEQFVNQPGGGSNCTWVSPVAGDGIRFVSITYQFAQTSANSKRIIRMIGSQVYDGPGAATDYTQNTPVTLTGAWDKQVALQLYQAQAHNYGGTHIMNVGHNLVPYATAVDATPPWVSAMKVHCPAGWVGEWCTGAPRVEFGTSDNAWGRGPTYLTVNGAVRMGWGQEHSHHVYDLDVADGTVTLDAYRTASGWATARHEPGWGGGEIEPGEAQPVGAPEETTVSVDRNAPRAQGLRLQEVNSDDTNMVWSQTDHGGSGITKSTVFVSRKGVWVNMGDAETDEGAMSLLSTLEEERWPNGTYPWKVVLTDGVGRTSEAAAPANQAIVVKWPVKGDPDYDPEADYPEDEEEALEEDYADDETLLDEDDVADTPVANRGPKLTTFMFAKGFKAKFRAPVRLRVASSKRGKVVVQVRRAGQRKVLVQRVSKVRALRPITMAIPTKKLKPGRYVISAKAKRATGAFGPGRGIAVVIPRAGAKKLTAKQKTAKKAAAKRAGAR